MNIFFATAAPGVERFTAIELSRLFPNLTRGVERDQTETAGSDINREGGQNTTFSKEPEEVFPNLEIQPEPGGVSFRGDLSSLYRANLHLRTASRILARLGMPFLARDFSELEQKATRLPWEHYLTAGQPVALHVTCHKSRLYHSEAVAERVLNAIAGRMGKASPRLKAGDEDSKNPAQLIVVRLDEDRCTISMDASGELLHRRGYRLASAKAPLRETLAAAMLMASGWDGQETLLDSFCGSGTIPIEAALMAHGIPPGANRHFAFMDWPGFDKAVWQSMLAQTTSRPSNTGQAGACVHILASDRDAGAVKIAQENAARAGVERYIEFKCQAVSSITPPTERGWIVTNPPYGRRIGGGKDLRNLYAQFGNVVREKCPGWNVAILCSDPMLLGQTRLRLDLAPGFVNGGIPVRLGCGQVDKD